MWPGYYLIWPTLLSFNWFGTVYPPFGIGSCREGSDWAPGKKWNVLVTILFPRKQFQIIKKPKKSFQRWERGRQQQKIYIWGTLDPLYWCFGLKLPNRRDGGILKITLLKFLWKELGLFHHSVNVLISLLQSVWLFFGGWAGPPPSCGLGIGTRRVSIELVGLSTLTFSSVKSWYSNPPGSQLSKTLR